MGWIATKEIKTARFTLQAGMPLPSVFNGYSVVRQLRKQYGNDAIAFHDYRRDGEFGMDARKLNVTVTELKGSLAKSEKTVTELSAANATLSNEVEDSDKEVQRLTERVAFLENEKTRGGKAK